MSYMLARMGHCQLYIDYGPDVAIHDVLIPASGFVPPQDILSPLLDEWKVPDGFSFCRAEDKCITERFPANFPPDSKWDKPPTMLLEGTSDQVAIGPIPRYRFAFQYTTGRLFRDHYKQTALILPGFTVETGAACALGNLFHLSPDAAKYDNDGRLFTEILPILRNNPVLALYVRTGNAEKHVVRNDNATDAKKMPNQDEIVDATVRTALELERQYLAGEVALGGYGRSKAKPLPTDEIFNFVWLVISDDKQVKERIMQEYNDQSVGPSGSKDNNRHLQQQTGNSFRGSSKEKAFSGKLDLGVLKKKQNLRTPPDRPKLDIHVGGTKVVKPVQPEEEKEAAAATAQITRKVLGTSARGAHTRLQDGISTVEFGEALIDWCKCVWFRRRLLFSLLRTVHFLDLVLKSPPPFQSFTDLIGESDAVIASSMYSFGMTAALRTARPVYDPMKYKESNELRRETLVYEGSPKNEKDNVLAIMDKFCLSHKGFKGSIAMLGNRYDMDCVHRRRLRSGERRFANFTVTLLGPHYGAYCASICIL